MSNHRTRITRAVLPGLVLATSLGCAYRVRPPDKVADPVAVVIVDHGIHSSLVLPRGSEAAVEYAYGQWDWFALDRVAWYRAPGALLLPGKAGLGRREFQVPATLADIQAALPAEHYHVLLVDRARATMLEARLDAHFDATTERTFNSRLGLEFVPDPTPYSLLHHCNTRVVDWLRELGCAVAGLGPDSDFEIIH